MTELKRDYSSRISIKGLQNQQNDIDRKISKYGKGYDYEYKNKEELLEDFTNVVKSFGSFSTNPYCNKQIMVLENLIDDYDYKFTKVGLTQDDLTSLFFKITKREKIKAPTLTVHSNKNEFFRRVSSCIKILFCG